MFFPASVFPPVLAPILLCSLFSFCAKPPSRGIFLISVSVSACDAALILMKRCARASPAEWALALSRPRRIFSPTWSCLRAVTRARRAIHYRRCPGFLLLLLLWGLASAIFFLSAKSVSSFATFRLPILREGSQWVPFPELQTRLHHYSNHGAEEFDVSFPICPATLSVCGLPPS